MTYAETFRRIINSPCTSYKLQDAFKDADLLRDLMRLRLDEFKR